jgi:hypothetical protein
MNSLALKIGAILIFATGVVAFVAFRSGYFDDETIIDPIPEVRPTADIVEPENDPVEDTTIRVKEKIPLMVAPNNNDEDNPTIKVEDFDRDMMHSSKSMMVVEPEDIRMYSSKSSTVFKPSDIRAFSSKSAPIIQPSDFGKPEKPKDSARIHLPNANESIFTPANQESNMNESGSDFFFRPNRRLEPTDTTDK